MARHVKKSQERGNTLRKLGSGRPETKLNAACTKIVEKTALRKGGSVAKCRGALAAKGYKISRTKLFRDAQNTLLQVSDQVVSTVPPDEAGSREVCWPPRSGILVFSPVSVFARSENTENDFQKCFISVYYGPHSSLVRSTLPVRQSGLFRGRFCFVPSVFARAKTLKTIVKVLYIGILCSPWYDPRCPCTS